MSAGLLLLEFVALLAGLAAIGLVLLEDRRR
jgi:hypothetical protein